jgi:hypothetical protein
MMEKMVFKALSGKLVSHSDQGPSKLARRNPKESKITSLF